MKMNRTDITYPELIHAYDILECLQDGQQVVEVKIRKIIVDMLRDAISEAGRNKEIRPMSKVRENNNEPDTVTLSVWLTNKEGTE